MKRHKSLLVVGLAFGLLYGASLPAMGQTVRVAVAANAQFVVQALKAAFEKKTEAKIEVIISSSGKLTAQILHGAPYDIFLSADMKYPERLFEEGYTLDNPQVYAYGSLVLWTLKNINLRDTLKGLKNQDIGIIAVANPKTAPYGLATIQALKEAGIYDEVEDKIVWGESISQVNQYLLSGAADAAFTAKSVVMAPPLAHKGRWIEINDTLYSPIVQGTVMLKHAQENSLQTIKAFYQFLFSTEGKSIFKSYGYRIK